jgi:hypothetical protein
MTHANALAVCTSRYANNAATRKRSHICQGSYTGQATVCGVWTMSESPLGVVARKQAQNKFSPRA